MNANELRIGNLVYHRYKVDPGNRRDEWVINAILPGDIVNCVEYPQNYKPVPLTPEILQAAGFHYLNSNTKGGRYYVESPYIGGELKAEIAWWPLTGVISINSTFNADGEELQYTELYLPHIKCLHQLMNLWHSLTGSELTINLEKVKV